MLGIEVDDLLSEPSETQAAHWNKDERAILVNILQPDDRPGFRLQTT